MDYLTTLAVFLLLSLFTSSYATTLEIRNNCPFVVWVAAVASVGNGSLLSTSPRLDRGESWTINDVPSVPARIWGRTNCKFDISGSSGCRTGDCGGGLLCKEMGKPPNTLAEFTLNQFNDLDIYDISLVSGFNLPMKFTPTNSSAAGKCRAISCTADINGQCPRALWVGGGCNDPCTTFGAPKYCCTDGAPCDPTNYSRFFKEMCPDAYSYRQDEENTTFTCPSGSTDYRVVFCP